MDYSSEVWRRFRRTPGAGRLASGLPGRVCGAAEDRSLNVWVRFELQVLAGRVVAVRFQAYGCPHTIAAASWVAEWLEGRNREAFAALDVPALAEHLEIPTEKLGKLLRVEDALLECGRRLDEMQASMPETAGTDRT